MENSELKKKINIRAEVRWLIEEGGKEWTPACYPPLLPGITGVWLKFWRHFQVFFLWFVFDEVLLHRPGWPRPCCVLALSSQRSIPLCLPVLASKVCVILLSLRFILLFLSCKGKRCVGKEGMVYTPHYHCEGCWLPRLAQSWEFFWLNACPPSTTMLLL